MKKNFKTNYFQLDREAEMQLEYAKHYFEDVISVYASKSQLIRLAINMLVDGLDDFTKELQDKDDLTCYTETRKIAEQMKDLRYARNVEAEPESLPEMSIYDPIFYHDFLNPVN